MALYRYRAKAPDGTVVSGVIEADSEFDAVEHIKKTCPVIEKIAEERITRGQNAGFSGISSVSYRTLSVTASQFAVMLRAGIPVVRAAELISDQTGDKLMKRILKECAVNIKTGVSFADSLFKYGNKIPAAFVETVRAGEESGTLDRCFERLSEYYGKAHRVRQKIRSALVYPAFLIVLAAVVVWIVTLRLVPVMTELFDNMGTPLPAPTRILIGISGFVSRYGYLILAGVMVMIIAYRIFGKTEKCAAFVSKMRFKIPIIGKITSMNCASQFSNTVSALLDAGLPLAKVLRITAKVMDNCAAGLSIENMASGIENGGSFDELIKNNPYLPDMCREMASVGDSSGSLPQALASAGKYYDAESEQAVALALGILEPAVTVLLGVFIGFIVIAIYIPMFNMYGGIR